MAVVFFYMSPSILANSPKEMCVLFFIIMGIMVIGIVFWIVCIALTDRQIRQTQSLIALADRLRSPSSAFEADVTEQTRKAVLNMEGQVSTEKGEEKHERTE